MKYMLHLFIHDKFFALGVVVILVIAVDVALWAGWIIGHAGMGRDNAVIHPPNVATNGRVFLPPLEHLNDGGDDYILYRK